MAKTPKAKEWMLSRIAEVSGTVEKMDDPARIAPVRGDDDLVELLRCVRDQLEDVLGKLADRRRLVIEGWP